MTNEFSIPAASHRLHSTTMRSFFRFRILLTLSAMIYAVEVQKRSSGCDVCRSVICRTCAARSCAIADGHPFPE